jgi:hypothetical protein
MRFIVLALALIALASPAVAQKGDFGRGQPLAPDPKPTFDEKKYKSAVESIPNAQKNNDPWAGARDTTAAPTPAAAPAKKPRQ